MKEKLVISSIYMEDTKAVKGFSCKENVSGYDVKELAKFYSDNGADELIVFDFSKTDEEHEKAIGKLKEICDISEVPVMGAGNVKRMEDVKKILYAGCKKAILNFSKESNVQLLEEVSKKFGKDKIVVAVKTMEEFQKHQKEIEELAHSVLCLQDICKDIRERSNIEVILHSDKSTKEEILSQFKEEYVDAISGSFVNDVEVGLMSFKRECKEMGIPVNTFESKIPWSQFNLNSDGMVPVIVQDYKTDEVLMLAYMNEEAYKVTLETGKMTYWSRSRNELWTKGLTSGHVQYVKTLTIDCDNDTILAKVSQIGVACHTGSRTCFFNELVKKDYEDTNPLHVFQSVFDVILDRKVHPKEGSYTNYLFDKGIDKILKKVGEECTEIVIAAKNPDKEEIKYEISDFLYHVMVLMAEKGVTWEDITRELAHR